MTSFRDARCAAGLHIPERSGTSCGSRMKTTRGSCACRRRSGSQNSIGSRARLVTAHKHHDWIERVAKLLMEKRTLNDEEIPQL
jgi:hypothetical protein